MPKDSKSEQELLELYKRRVSDRKKGLAARRKRHIARPQKANEILAAFFKDQPETLKKMDEARALLAWNRYVGPEAAPFSEAIKVNGHEIVVLVSDPLWMHQLVLLKNQILKLYKRDFPRLRIDNLFFKRKTSS
ncbi:MAG: DUF721 domain-containing protein [Proteobacteria bacterium]|nr:DUF721 domain-containing protein [Pseudomonadota bacterium]NDC24628.1 DUF721 domain-containing protein [Pseudomonadota bacterium]NDD05030.1 DUF721 domain-containing protein [Pseudomonadota bacterium]NDG26654.1 DUF721 domain-containing protein [Pseudomonadota bacterium]